MIGQTIGGNNQFVYPATYGLFGGIFFFAIFQLRFLTQMLRTFEAVLIVPIYQCSFTISLIIFGGVYFEEFKLMSWTQIAISCVAVVICCCGIAVLTNRPIPTDEEVAAALGFDKPLEQPAVEMTDVRVKEVANESMTAVPVDLAAPAPAPAPAAAAAPPASTATLEVSQAAIIQRQTAELDAMNVTIAQQDATIIEQAATIQRQERSLSGAVISVSDVMITTSTSISTSADPSMRVCALNEWGSGCVAWHTRVRCVTDARPCDLRIFSMC